MENPSTVTLTADNTQADIIEKVSINILITDKSFHSFAPAQVQQREYRTELIDKGKNISFSSVVERVQDNITYNLSCTVVFDSAGSRRIYRSDCYFY